MSKLTLDIESPLSADAARLIGGSEAALREVYTEDECFTFTADQLDKPNIDFVVARHSGNPVGCVALVRYDTYAEVKRLYVDGSARGLGVAKALMDYLESAALAAGITDLRLETGPKLAAAVALYAARGYTECGRFGEYEDHPASLFMAKDLS